MADDEVPVSTPETAPTPEIATPIPVRAIPFAASSQIADIQYDEENMALIVTFIRGGSVYRYSQVPSSVADGFTQAPSAGRYLGEFVKGQYDYEKIA
jgi:hypothetical protein